MHLRLQGADGTVEPIVARHIWEVFPEVASASLKKSLSLSKASHGRRYTRSLPACQRSAAIVIVLVESWCSGGHPEGRLMDENNPVVKLCAQGMQAEGDGRPEDARELYGQAWVESRDGFEAAAAAHYLARQQPSAEETFRWNDEALKRADAAGAAGDERVEVFYPSLYPQHGQIPRGPRRLGRGEEMLRDGREEG